MSKVLVTESYLTAIGGAIRSKNGSTTTYKPKEMAPAILALTSESVLNTLIDGTVTSIYIPTGVTSVRSNVFNGCSQLTKVTVPSTVTTINSGAFSGTNISEIDVDGDYNSISGNPWGSSDTTTIVWLKGTKYPITSTQSPNETITVTVDGKSYTSSFEYYKGATLTATATPASGYKAGALSASSVTISGPVTFTIGEATKLQMQTGTKFTFNKNNNMGPIGLIVNGKTYILNGCETSNALFDFGSNIFGISMKYDSSVTPAITSGLFNIGGALWNFFNNCATKLTIESSGVGLLWSSPDIVDDFGDFGGAGWGQGNASAASTTGDWTKTSTNSMDKTSVWNKIMTAYNNGDNIIVEFIA